jgi:hypothetical protein
VGGGVEVEGKSVVETWSFTLAKPVYRSKYDAKYEVSVVLVFANEYLRSVSVRSSAGDFVVECRNTVDYGEALVDLVLDLVEKMMKKMEVISATRKTEITETL